VLPEILGTRRLTQHGGKTWDIEYRPDALPGPGRYVRWDEWHVGIPVGEGWVRIYGEGLNYPYLAHGAIVGGPRA
jgi:hypothetical protein